MPEPVYTRYRILVADFKEFSWDYKADSSGDRHQYKRYTGAVSKRYIPQYCRPGSTTWAAFQEMKQRHSTGYASIEQAKSALTQRNKRWRDHYEGEYHDTVPD